MSGNERMTRIKQFFHVNKRLLPAKVVIFCYYGSVQCVLPFITIMMRNIGFTISDITIINTVLPVFSIAGPISIGMLADKLGRYKLVTTVCLFLVTLFFSGLLFVPSIHSTKHNNSINISNLTSTFNLSCTTGDYLTLTHNQCSASRECSNATITFKLEDCLPEQKHDFATNCSLLYNATCYNVTEILHWTHVENSSDNNNNNSCVYQETTKRDCLVCPSLECSNLQCNLSKNVSICNEDEEESANRGGDDWLLSFVTFFVLRIMAQFFMSSSYPLLDGVVLETFRRHQGKYGRHRVWAQLAQMFFPLFSGLLMDYAASYSGTTTFWPSYMLLNILCIVSITFLRPLDFSEKKMEGTVFKNIRLLTNSTTIPTFVAAFCYGLFPGIITVFLPIYLRKLGSPLYLIGLIAVMPGVASLVFLYFSDTIVKRLGPWKIFSFGFFVGGIRFFIYSFIMTPWLAIPTELLKAFANTLPLVALILHGKNIAPSGLLTTMVGIVRALIYGCGRSIGILIGGTLINIHGERTAFQILASIQIVFGIMAFFVWCCQERKQQKRNGTSSVMVPLQSGEEEENTSHQRDDRNNRKLSRINQ